MFHYTDKDGYNAIVSQPTWLFLATQPPGNHPIGAYFTELPPEIRQLAKRLRIPRRKLQWVFEFMDVGDLIRIRGGRGDDVAYSPKDYPVDPSRQLHHGETGL